MGIVYCTHGTCPIPRQRTRKFIREFFDTLSIPNFAIVKGPDYGDRRGQSDKQKEYHKAHEPLKRGEKKKKSGNSSSQRSHVMDCFSLLLGVVLPPRTSFMTGQALSSCVAARGSGVVPLLFGPGLRLRLCSAPRVGTDPPRGGRLFLFPLPSLDNVGVPFTGGSSFLTQDSVT